MSASCLDFFGSAGAFHLPSTYKIHF